MGTAVVCLVIRPDVVRKLQVNLVWVASKDLVNGLAIYLWQDLG